MISSFKTCLQEGYCTDQMILIDNKFIFANKLGEIAVYDSKNTKNTLKKFHDHMGAVKDLAVDSDNNLYSGNLKSRI